MEKRYAKVGEHLEATYIQTETNREVEHRIVSIEKRISAQKEVGEGLENKLVACSHRIDGATAAAEDAVRKLL